jgi:anti-sigma B factor antagonist
MVTVRGELDVSTAPEFRQRVAERVGLGAKRVAVDLTQADFIDSSGIQVLINEQKRLKGRGGRLIVVCNEPRMLDLFRLTGLDRLCEVVPSRAELPA